MVALGDSYFCGEGNPDEPGEPAAITGTIACNLATFTKFLIEKADINVPMDKPPVWQEKKVHRSYKSGVSLAVEALEDGREGRVITFLNFARSGASIEKGFSNPRDEDDWTDLGEIEEAKQTIGDRPVDVLLISVGGNDIHFSDRLLDLLREDLPIVGDGGLLGDDDLNREREVKEALRRLAVLPEKFGKLARDITKFKPKHVFLMEYPVSQFDTFDENGEVVTNSGCGIFDGPDMDIDAQDAEVIRMSGEKLCESLREIAAHHGWRFVDGIRDGFAGHGRCSEDKYFVSAEESCMRQGNFKGTMHPNEKGNQVYADCIEAAVRDEMGWKSETGVIE